MYIWPPAIASGGTIALLSQIANADTCVLGCGNTLFGDDGFGPAVIEHLLANYELPPQVVAEDVGTGAADILFDLLLMDRRPARLLIVDASGRAGEVPGGLTELDPEQLEPAKGNDFSVHHFPSLNLLSELKRTAGLDVRLLALMDARIPESVAPGLSPAAEAAVPRACGWIMEQIARQADAHG